MRTYGRVYADDGSYQWVEITTDANGFDDDVWVTTLIQCLKLSIGESPFFANYGIPAQRSVIQQIFPNFYVTQTQTQFSQYFASLIVSIVNSATPTYNINVTKNQGAKLAISIPV
ncbi:hypothetical protein [Herbaspirillum huttiense]|uniref:hypothetical protein n=1 Tax=Herbaspirillum huttiense TaxID=863372 RepID=UPI0031DB97C6